MDAVDTANLRIVPSSQEYYLTQQMIYHSSIQIYEQEHSLRSRKII